MTNEKQEIPLELASYEKFVAVNRKTGTTTGVDISIKKGDENIPVIKLENDTENGLRVLVYTSPDLEEPFEISLKNYRSVNDLNLTSYERAVAEEKLFDAWSYNPEIVSNLLMNGLVGISNKSDYELMTDLGFDDLREFKKDLN